MTPANQSNPTAAVAAEPKGFCKGETVKIKPEWQDDGDADIIFLVAESENGGRCTIEARLGLPLNPQQRVTCDMIEYL